MVKSALAWRRSESGDLYNKMRLDMIEMTSIYFCEPDALMYAAEVELPNDIFGLGGCQTFQNLFSSQKTILPTSFPKCLLKKQK